MVLGTIIMMRTTVNLPDDVYELARSLSVLQRIPLGEALAALVREGHQATAPTGRQILGPGGFPTFPARKGAPVITLEQTLRALDEDPA